MDTPSVCPFLTLRGGWWGGEVPGTWAPTRVERTCMTTPTPKIQRRSLWLWLRCLTLGLVENNIVVIAFLPRCSGPGSVLSVHPCAVSYTTQTTAAQSTCLTLLRRLTVLCMDSGFWLDGPACFQKADTSICYSIRSRARMARPTWVPVDMRWIQKSHRATATFPSRAGEDGPRK